MKYSKYTPEIVGASLAIVLVLFVALSTLSYLRGRHVQPRSTSVILPIHR